MHLGGSGSTRQSQKGTNPQKLRGKISTVGHIMPQPFKRAERNCRNSTSIQKSYITSEIHSRICLQGKTSKNLIEYTSSTVGLKYTKSFQNTAFHFPKCSPTYTKYPPNQHLKHLDLPPLPRAPEPKLQSSHLNLK